jgi:hypothetical protein
MGVRNLWNNNDKDKTAAFDGKSILALLWCHKYLSGWPGMENEPWRLKEGT